MAIKVLKKKYLPEKQLEKFKKEIDIMEKIAHPNVVSFYGVCFAEDNFLLVTELMKTDLLTILWDPHFKLSLYEKVKIGREIARGCNWIHSLGILHRDLKSSNILVSFKGGELDVRVCDFGLSQVQKNKELMMRDSGGARGTINWMAPEVLSLEEFNEKSDVWGFGVVMWELITRKLPYAGCSREEIIQYVVKEKKVLKVTTELESLKELVESCLEFDPAKRPSFSSLVGGLNTVMVDAAIDDPIGRQLWKEAFVKEEGLLETVTWGQFWDTLADFVRSVDLSNLFAHVCLKELLVQRDPRSNELLVGILDYGKLLGYFPMQSKKKTMMTAISDLCAKECFFGEIDKVEAERYLDNTPPGTFLIRFSSRPGTFTISRRTEKGGNEHARLLFDKWEGSFGMDGEVYGSLEEFLEAEKEYLRFPRKGSKFMSFLEEEEVKDAYKSNFGGDKRKGGGKE